MLYIKNISENESVVSSSAEAKLGGWNPSVFECRHDWSVLELAESAAKRLNAHYGYKRFIATDSGESCSPRYDVIELPKLGDEVSKSFNGDYYPCGTVTSISPTFKKITTSSGETFYRRKDTGAWLSGPFALIKGVESRLSPEF